MFDVGLYFYRTGFASAAFSTSRLLDDLAHKSHDRLWIRKAHTFAGIINSDAGNIAEAVVRYHQALLLARELGDAESEVSVLCNLGPVLNYGSLHNEAIGCLRRAIAIAGPRPEFSKFIPIAQCNIAQGFLYLEDFEEGFLAIEAALRLSRPPATSSEAFSMTIREFTYVQLALETGKIARARDHAALCRDYSRWGGNPRSAVLADIAVGLCEIRGGNVETGISALESALARAGAFVMSRIDALIALVKANDEIGRPERALEHMRELLNHVHMYRATGMRALLALPAESHLSADQHNLRALEVREAKLRAKVAEQEVVNTQIEILERLAVTADLKEEDSGEHGYRVGRLSSLLAQDLGWELDRRAALEHAARLHDIGKIGVPDRILLSSHALKEAERRFMSSHASIGAELLASSRIAQLDLAQEVARSHHENWDGTGYPSKTAGKRIPIAARIVALADVFDSLTHGRPFSPPWPIDEALEQLRQGCGTQFDPELTERFLNLIARLRAEHPDLDAYLGKAGRHSPFLQARNKIRAMLEEERENERKTTVGGNETRH